MRIVAYVFTFFFIYPHYYTKNDLNVFSLNPLQRFVCLCFFLSSVFSTSDSCIHRQVAINLIYVIWIHYGMYPFKIAVSSICVCLQEYLKGFWYIASPSLSLKSSSDAILPLESFSENSLSNFYNSLIRKKPITMCDTTNRLFFYTSCSIQFVNF